MAKFAISAAFLADLEIVCAKADGEKQPLNFAMDLECAYACAMSLKPAIVSAADFGFLEEKLKAWRNLYKGRLQQYLNRLPPDDPLFGHVSLFRTMDFGRLETAHTRALAWMLDDQEHGFGHQLLEVLLRHLLGDSQFHVTRVDRVDSEYSVENGTGRIDVLARGRGKRARQEDAWLLVIEAKIDAEEGDEQLAQYDKWIAKNAHSTNVLRVFLTPDGRKNQTGSEMWQELSFADLTRVFRLASGLHDKPGYHFLRYYLTGVLRDICKLSIPVGAHCEDPYTIADYLQYEMEGAHGQPR